jgi:hypothetical protein
MPSYERYELMWMTGSSQNLAKTPGEMEGETTFMCVESGLQHQVLGC